MRCWVAPIRLEISCYEELDENERICPICNTNQIESEIHVLSCPLYDIRDPLLVNQITSYIASNFKD